MTYLTTGKRGSKIELVDDIGMVDGVDQEEYVVRHESDNAIVVGVPLLDSYTACMKYNGKICVDEKDARLGRCGMLQRIDRCKKCVSTASRRDRERSTHPARRVVMEIAKTYDVSEYDLLSASPFSLHYAADSGCQ